MIDWDRVNELKAEVGTEDFREVVTLFLEEVDEVIDRLKSRPDSTRFEQDLHFLKSSSLNLGFATFSGLCRDGERAAREGQTAAVDLPELIAAYLSSRSEFLARVNG
ncbi:Hpt domain-containing protein [Celeribacter indicus]|uniref:Hpt protein n=1 Tax=Celeribacter indicus TaxID=1208324 RepID=A0A0B5DXG5_9RHOB|nr:Hpt domain-containing protein [Celeribacter indicus]AJE44952.1 Hpt protein [Celeribacter indicus]SDW96426.1 Hpt domain-containing protein [Celeribacter indicus]